MGVFEQTVEQAILKYAGKLQLKQTLNGVAKNITDTTCTVERENAPTLHGVRLNSIDDDLQSFVTIVPADGSNVFVGIIENLQTEAVVLRCSEVEKVILKIGKTTLLIDKAGYKVESEGENLNKIISDLITEVTKIIVIQGTSPNVSALENIKLRLAKVLK